MKSRHLRKIFTRVTSLVCFLTMLLGTTLMTSEVHAETTEVHSPVVTIDEEGDRYVTWDKITFGNYYQEPSGYTAEPIKWRILSISGNDAFLMADSILDTKPYDEWEYGKESATWEDSTIRYWLNNEFYQEAFTEQEQAIIKTVEVENRDVTVKDYYTNEETTLPAGNDTVDMIYLLSIDEACNPDYGFMREYGQSYHKYNEPDYNRSTLTTQYSGKCCINQGEWWLRSPDYTKGAAACIGRWGQFMPECSYKSNSSGIRPVLHVDITSSLIINAGEVDDNGETTNLDDGYQNPRENDDKTIWDCVYFGSYKQTATFNQKTPIEWRVLSVDGTKAMLLSEKILTRKNFDGGNWAESKLRSWMNQEFLNEIMDTTQQEALIPQALQNNSYYPDLYNNIIEPIPDTVDKVFLLSLDEVNSIQYGFDATFHTEKSEDNTNDDDNTATETRQAVPTQYTNTFIREGINQLSFDHTRHSWGLRTAFQKLGYRYENEAPFYIYYEYTVVQGIDYDGSFIPNNFNSTDIGIRPAIYVDLTKADWNYAGIVSSDRFPEDNPCALSGHTFGTEWVATQTGHSLKPTCGHLVTPNELPHTFLEKVDREATATKVGLKHKECTVCGYKGESIEIPKLGATDEENENDDGNKNDDSSSDNKNSSNTNSSENSESDNSQNTKPDNNLKLKSIKLLSVKAKKGTKEITGKLSVTKAKIQIKVGNQKWKNAKVTKKTFKLKTMKLKKKTKIKIKVSKSGYKTVSKTYTVK